MFGVRTFLRESGDDLDMALGGIVFLIRDLVSNVNGLIRGIWTRQGIRRS